MYHVILLQVLTFRFEYQLVLQGLQNSAKAEDYNRLLKFLNFPLLSLHNNVYTFL